MTMEQQLRIKDLMDTSGVRFGTSGARGQVAAMTPEVCFAYTLAFLQVLAPQKGSQVAVGIDLRPSSPAIAQACLAAVSVAGLKAVYCGPLPTPALAFYAQEQGIPAIMVTGSHIPFDRNGIKFYRSDGEITKGDEVAIAGAKVAVPQPIPLRLLPEADRCAVDLYLERYLAFFPPRFLAGMRLGFYEHSSVARDLLGRLLEAFGAEVISLGRTDQFVPIDTEAVSDADVARARAWAREHAFDAIISTDGDADRPLIGDEHGDWLRGDIVGLLCAQALGVTALATPVSCNTAIEQCGAFAQVVRTRIGSPYVIDGMAQLARSGAQRVAGFEANGGFLLGSAIEQDGRRLASLPTRDATLPILALLALARSRGVPLSQLAISLPQRFTASDRIQNFATETSGRLLAAFAASGPTVAELFGDLCGAVVAQDQTDGLRITFANGEIVHLRRSGNAPELRCYAESVAPSRSQQLAKEALQRIEAHAAHNTSLG